MSVLRWQNMVTAPSPASRAEGSRTVAVRLIALACASAAIAGASLAGESVREDERSTDARAAALPAAAVHAAALHAPALAPAGTWTRHACADCIVAIDAGLDAVWVGTVSGGIVRWSTEGGSYERWTRADGLPGELAYSITAVPDGSAWAMTGAFSSLARAPEALARFTPGAGWEEVALPDWFGVAYQRGMDADVDRLWIATSSGLALYTAGTWQNIGAAADALPSESVFDVAIAPDGTVWAATAGGVARLGAAGAWERVPWPAGASAFEARVIHVAADGRVWVAVAEPPVIDSSGVMEFDGSTWRHHVPADGLRHGTVTGIASTTDGRVWFAHNSSTVDGISVWDGVGWSGVGRADGLPHGIIGEVAADPDGAVWAASIDDGLGRRAADGSWEAVRTDAGPYKVVTFDVETSGDMLWFAHFNMDIAGSRYISRLDGSGWRDFALEDGLTAASTLVDPQADAAIEPGGAYWRGVRSPDESAEGWSLVRYDGSAAAYFGTADGLPDAHVSDLAMMQDGALWAAYDAGLFVWDGAGWGAADLTGLPSADLDAVAMADRVRGLTGGVVEREGWVGGTDFVARGTGRPGEAWTVFAPGPETGLPTGAITDIDSRLPGGTWIVTVQGAVARLDGDRWTAWSPDEVTGETVIDSANGILVDDRGGVWVGFGPATSDSTVAYFDGTAWSQLGPTDGAPESAVFDVSTGPGCSVWIVGITAIAQFEADGGCPTAPGTATPTSSASPSPSVPSPTSTPLPPPTALPPPSPMPSPTSDPDAPCVCAATSEKVPAAVISAVLANPASVGGWGLPRDPGKPVGPFNPMRECLSLRNPATRYHPLFNGLVWSAGCR